MSLEESMATLAESNLKLAAAMDRYASIIEKVGVQVQVANGTAAATSETPAATAATTDKPARGGKGKGKPAAASEPESPKLDEFGDPISDDSENDAFDVGGTAAREYTEADVRAAVTGVKDQVSKDAALAIIKGAGAANLAQIDKSKYGYVIAEAAKHGVKV